MAKRILLACALMLLIAGNAEARLRARNVQHINQSVTTNTTITADFGGYWYIYTDQDIQINLDGGDASTAYATLKQNNGQDYYNVYVDKSTGVNFEPTVTTNIEAIVTDQ
jgi:hypothetical protein